MKERTGKLPALPIFDLVKNDPMMADALLAEGACDFITMGRKLLADPELPNKLNSDATADATLEVRPCMYHYRCIGNIFLREGVRCASNPMVGRERELQMDPALVARRVLVVGGGPAGMEKRNKAKAELLYGTLDRLRDFYAAPVEKDSRSLMNAVFLTPTPELDDLFCAEADKEGITGMKGHRAAGGMRVSLYNAISLEDVKTLAAFMDSFAKRRG